MIKSSTRQIVEIHHRRNKRKAAKIRKKKLWNNITTLISVLVAIWMVLSYAEILHKSSNGTASEGYSKYNFIFLTDNVFGTHLFDEIPRK